MLDKALEYYLKSLKIKENHFGVGHVSTAVTLMNIGVVYKGQRKLD